MKKLLDAVFYRFHYKVLALLFATLLWLLAVNREISEVELQLKIHPIPTGNYRIIDYHPKVVTILVEGYRKDLIILREKGTVKFVLPANLLPNKDGKISVKIDKSRLILPIQSVKVKKIHPESITVEVENLIEKAVPVKLNIVGLKKGLKLDISPNYVIVYLPKDAKNSVKYVETEKVDLSSVKGKGEIHLKLVSKYRVEPNTVKITVREAK
ncbi:hypothetical protein [Phorcysia thermohydrogeniphila]|uniref:YbbR-like protein n=1 Tax=Phorcysia thermohydrogeniphila TaxID=936138 RepID=A0A4R1GHL8_9BACT|nr:hypothetical protein [Phorcysia thermohydrogeniphila]TCK06490.1 hypothetical protein CLV27_0291 [Phorcysia thermohydrogeniphila]